MLSLPAGSGRPGVGHCPTGIGPLAPAGHPPVTHASLDARHMRSEASHGRRLLLLDVSAVTATWVAVGLGMPASGGAVSRSWHAGLPIAATLVAIGGLRLYRSPPCSKRSTETVRVAVACAFGAALAVAVSAPGYGKALAGAILGGTGGVVLVSVSRWQFTWWLRACHAQGRFLRHVVLVGGATDALDAWTTFSTEPELGYEVVGVVIDSWPGWDLVAPEGTDGRAAVHIGVEQVRQVACETGASMIIALPGAMTGAQLRRLVRDGTSVGLRVQLWPGLSGRLRCVPLAGENSFYVELRRLRRSSVAVKRALDVVLASAGLIATAPLVLLAAAAIKIHDGGPVLFHQKRVGLKGEHFCLLKLRTMIPDAASMLPRLAVVNERTGPLFKMQRDPRVTPVGRVLRVTSLDEVPQLLNVLAGSMSLVGPRPALADEVARFDDELVRRHSVRPGITGLWQIEARHNPSFHAYRRLDLLYVDNWSLALDFSIMLATVPAVLQPVLRAISLSLRRRRAPARSAPLPARAGSPTPTSR